MNVRDWPLEKLMCLPDWCFGRRFGVFLQASAGAASHVFDISEIALPDVFVLWEFLLCDHGTEKSSVFIRLALGDQLPTTAAQVDSLQPLLPGWGPQQADPRYFRLESSFVYHLVNLRVPIQAQGRRLVVHMLGPETGLVNIDIAIVVSSMPTEIPSCLNY